MDCVACTPELDDLLLANRELSDAWNGLRRHHLRAGEHLARLGQPVRQAWRVETGLLRMFYLSADGQERNRSFHARGQWLGAGIPPNEAASPYTIEALEDSTVVEVPYAVLQVLQARHAGVHAIVLDALGKVFATQNQREADLLFLDAENRYKSFLKSYGPLVPRLPLHHVASYLGITNVALSRIRRRLKLNTKTGRE